MAATGADPETATAATFAGWWRRVGEARWPLALGALVSVALALGSSLGPWGALVVFAAVAAAALAPRRRVLGERAEAAGSIRADAREVGIERFAGTLPYPCFILDRRGLVRYGNASAFATFHIRAGETLTSRLRAPDVVATFERVARGGAAETVDFTERVPTERWFAAWLSRLDLPGGHDDRLVLLIEEMTERRRSERIRVDFVANASHELRTPLASLNGFIETLQGPAKDDPAARAKFLKVMHEQATRMSRLVNDLLSLSRIEMKAHVRPSGEVDLVAIVRHIGDALEPLGQEFGVAIEVETPPAPVIIKGDRDELIQVVENLVENACKYGQSGARVVVAVHAAAPTAGPSVSVRDFGPGIPAEHIPRLTERFYRIDVEASRKHRGTGLGLAIVKHILARHRARLAIDSRLGEGATFTVVFPQADDSALIDKGEYSSLNQVLTLS